MAVYLHSVPVEVGSTFRVDTASGSSTPTTVYEADMVTAVPNVFGLTGSTVRNRTPQGHAVFRSSVQTLYLKRLTYQGALAGDTPITSTGRDVSPAAGRTVPSTEVALGMLTTGEEVLPRWLTSPTDPLVSGTLVLSFWTARRDETINTLRTGGGSTVAAGLTRGRMGVYEVDPVTKGLTLVASTANDTGAWPSAFGVYSRATQAAWSKKAGTRYAFAVLAIGTTMPTLRMQYVSDADAALDPRLNGLLAGQTDLPSTITDAALTADYRCFQGLVLP